jgi:hypothetical protein
MTLAGNNSATDGVTMGPWSLIPLVRRFLEGHMLHCFRSATGQSVLKPL